MSNRGEDRRKSDRRVSGDRRKQQLPFDTERRLGNSRRDSSERRSGTDRRSN